MVRDGRAQGQLCQLQLQSLSFWGFPSCTRASSSPPVVDGNTLETKASMKQEAHFVTINVSHSSNLTSSTIAQALVSIQGLVSQVAREVWYLRDFQ